MGIDIVEDRLSFARILNKTLHRISDKGVGEHVCDVEKVLGDNVGGAAEVKICQLICLRTILKGNVKNCNLPFVTSQRRTRRQAHGIRSRGLSLTRGS